MPTVLVVDFWGPVRAALIARRVREAHCLQQIVPTRSPPRRSSGAPGHHPLRRAEVRERRGPAPPRPHLRPRRAAARASATAPSPVALQLGGEGRCTGKGGRRPHRASRSPEPRRAAARLPTRHPGRRLDEPLTRSWPPPTASPRHRPHRRRACGRLRGTRPAPLRRVPPEVHPHPQGQAIRALLYEGAGCSAVVDHALDHRPVRRGHPAPRSATRRSSAGLSGGVDSSRPPPLVHKAVGSQLTCVFVGTGLHAQGRGRPGRRDLPPPPGHRARPRPGAADRFFERASPASSTPRRSARPSASSSSGSSEEAIGGCPTPTRPGHALPRRHRAGHPDAAKVKSHHNVGGLPEDMDLSSCRAPPQPFFGTEVREVGASWATARRDRVAPALPGPGLGVRIIGEAHPEQLAILQHPRRCRPSRGDRRPRLDLAGVRRAAGHPQRRRHNDERTITPSSSAVTSEDTMTADWGPAAPRGAERIVAGDQ